MMSVRYYKREKKLENITEKEEEVIKESIDGVKYIVFQNKRSENRN